MVNRPIRKSKVQKRVNKTQSLKKRAGKKQSKQGKQGKQGKQSKQSKQRARVYRKKSKRGGMNGFGFGSDSDSDEGYSSNTNSFGRQDAHLRPGESHKARHGNLFSKELTFPRNEGLFEIKIYEKNNNYFVPLIDNSTKNNESFGFGRDFSYYNLTENEIVDNIKFEEVNNDKGTVLLNDYKENDTENDTLIIQITFKGKIYTINSKDNKDLACQLVLGLSVGGGDKQQKLRSDFLQTCNVDIEEYGSI
jgi:hypothetical protein